MLEVRRLPAFEDNYIWLAGEAGSKRVAIVDPGDAAPVLACLERDDLTPAAILITHHHGDHTGGAAELAQRFSLPVYGPANERITAVDHPVAEGDTVAIPGTDLRFQVLDTPGHTRGHLSYVGHGALFCGDTLFTAGCGRIFEGSPEQMYRSLEKIRALPDETLVYCAHEYTTANLAFARVAEPENRAIAERSKEVARARQAGEATVPASLGLEKRTNPFLHSHEEGLRLAAERFAERPLSTPAEVFAVVRHWKDTLD